MRESVRPAAEAVLLVALRKRGLQRLERIHFRANRTRLLSLSADRRTLNAHTCFRDAPPEILDAIARFFAGPRGSPAVQDALAAIRGWEGTREGLRRARAAAPELAGRQLPRPGHCCGTTRQRAYLDELYDRMNQERFAGVLLRVPLRLSARMRRRLGHVRFWRDADGRRRVVELALNPDLLLEGNEEQLIDTLVHEMAHIDAWLRYGHRGHGPPWKRIARAVGCVPRATCTAEVARHGRVRNTGRVPPLPAQPKAAPGSKAAPRQEPRLDASLADLPLFAAAGG
jgi:hypothetical protein